MQRFFLHVRAGDRIAEDLEGADYDSLEQAKIEAVRGAREIMAERVRQGVPMDGSSILIMNPDGEVVFELAFRDVIFD